MALVETDCVVLRSYDLAEADRIVVLLTRDHGVVRGVAKGAKRLKSKFGSGLEPFSFVRVAYFHKETLELVSIDKVELDSSNFEAASDPFFLQKFSYLADLVISLSPPHDPNQPVYRMMRACVSAAVQDQALLPGLGVYFELWLLRLSGYLPDWKRCERCGLDLAGDEATALTANDHMVCSTCTKQVHGRPTSRSLRKIIAAALSQPPAEFADGVVGQTGDLQLLSHTLRRLISRSVGREVTGETPLVLGR